MQIFPRAADGCYREGGFTTGIGELYRSAASGYTGTGARREPTCVEDKGMRLKQQWCSVLVAAMLIGLVGVTTVVAAGEQFLPVLSMREGANRAVGIPLGNGYIDY